MSNSLNSNKGRREFGDHPKKKPTSRSVKRQESTEDEVPVGEWVDVPHDKVVAVDTYKDREGVLRSTVDHSCVTWHWGAAHCTRRGIQPAEIVYDPQTGAPWCPQCWPIRQQFYETKRLQNLFGGAVN